ncbi:MAG TPA: FtsW/RodA/SpoVE family cell cycle protein [Pyrinomonadaceae bacterium]|nr:FtsW/RodA/SpoVE family cell cycle protein [Pyrinomonadaceae bacterium]
MNNRASTHLLLLLVIVGLEIAGYVAVREAAVLRGYEPPLVGAVRDLLLFVPLIALVLWLTRTTKFVGEWSIYTAAILLFAVGMLAQYRLYGDPEYNSRNKSEARAEKTQTLRLRYIDQYYDAEKKRMMGLLNATPASTSAPEIRRSNYTVGSVLTSTYTWVPLFAFFAFAVAYRFCIGDAFLLWLQKHSFIIVLLTLVPLVAAVATSSAGKSLGNMTPWEPSKIPFLVGFAGLLTARYKDLAQTYWGVPRARDGVPLIVMALIPFIPFFALKDFGQMLVFSGAYATLYLVAVRRWPQLLLFVGTVLLAVGVLVVGALPQNVQEQVPLLPTLSRPVQAILPNRIQQRFHLWLDGFDPPAPDTSWWRRDYNEALAGNPRMKELAEQSPAMQRTVNVDVWFDRIAFQPAQATFGLVAGRTTGRGLGLSFAEVIPVADSDYIYAAIGEELGLGGGLLIVLALVVLTVGGVRTSIEARDMFTKLCAAGLTAFIILQAAVNIGGVTRALPMTGITLPFVSHGGFSLITSFAMLGMLLAFSHRNRRDRQDAARVLGRPAASPVRREDFGPEAVQ